MSFSLFIYRTVTVILTIFGLLRYYFVCKKKKKISQNIIFKEVTMDELVTKLLAKLVKRSRANLVRKVGKLIVSDRTLLPIYNNILKDYNLKIATMVNKEADHE